jgi:predicted  nucleic acid-binding Zn-ribbon protein
MTSTDLRRLQQIEVELSVAKARIRELEDELVVLRTAPKETDSGC